MAKSDGYNIVLLPGDGIGAEVAAQAKKLVEAVAATAGIAMHIETIPCGGAFYTSHGSRDWPEGAEEACDSADAILLGAVGWPAPGGGPVNMKDGKMAGWSAVIGNRIRLGLYANVRRVKMLPGTLHAISGRKVAVWSAENVDMVFVRENTEGMYSNMGGIHSSFGEDVLATDVRLITRQASERVIRYAFELCAARDRGAPSDGAKRVTCIVKNNVLDGCRLFERIFHEVGEELRKCIWPTKNELIQSTMVVVVSVLLLAAFVGFCDFVLMKILRFVIPS